MSIESYLADVRTYLEGISSQQSQILMELKRLSNQVNQANQVSQPNPLRGTLETEAPPSELKTEAPDAFIAAVTQSVDLSKTKAAAKPATKTATTRTTKKATATK